MAFNPHLPSKQKPTNQTKKAPEKYEQKVENKSFIQSQSTTDKVINIRQKL